MNNEEFRAAIEHLGFNQASFARRLIELGDPRQFQTVQRSVANYAQGVSGVPAEVEMVLAVMARWPEVRGRPVTRRVGRPPKGG